MIHSARELLRPPQLQLFTSGVSHEEVSNVVRVFAGLTGGGGPSEWRGLGVLLSDQLLDAVDELIKFRNVPRLMSRWLMMPNQRST